MTASVYLTVTLEDRSDDGLRVYSDDLPGLLLSGPDKKSVCDRIAPAIQALLEYKGIQVLNVFPSQPFMDAARQASPRDVGVHVVQHEMFVVMLANKVVAEKQHAYA